MREQLCLRRRFEAGDRTFTVVGESWFDAASGEWKARVRFVPLDRSLPGVIASEALLHARRRDEVERALGSVSDRALAKAYRSIALPTSRRARGR
ncbi:MAG TPA: hypothetical protein VF041_07515 [Gemmatimonadaceae bacterium]